MTSYLKMASKINMGSMSHTSLATYIKIWESKNQTDDPIEVPTEKDGTLLLSTLIGQYPNTAGLRFMSDTGAWRGLKCEDNVVYPPPDGWGTRDYYIVAGPPNLKRSAEDEDGPTSKSQRTEEESEEEEEEEEEPEMEEPEEEEEEERVEEPVVIKKEPEEEKSPEFILQALPYEMTNEELRKHLEQFGELESCAIVMNKLNGGSRGYAFLRYKTNEGAKKAQEGVHIFKGRRYYLQLANKSKGAMGKKMHNHNKTRIKLFVGHLPAGADESHLRDYFSKYGVLKDVYVPKPNKGYGFIELGSQEVADKVLADTHILMDTFLNVNYPATMKQSDKKRLAEKMAKEQEKMAKEQANNRPGGPGILGYYGVGPMSMPNDRPGDNFNGPYRDPYRNDNGPNFNNNFGNRNNFNFNNDRNNFNNRNNFNGGRNFENNFDDRNNFNGGRNFENRDNFDDRNNFNMRGRGNFRGRGGGRGGLPRPPWATD